MKVLSRIPSSQSLFYKVRPALYLSGQLKLFHIHPVNMVNSKKSIQTRWPEGKRIRMYFVKCRRLVEFLTEQKDLFCAETLKAKKQWHSHQSDIDEA
jgi:hypothetical protein